MAPLSLNVAIEPKVDNVVRFLKCAPASKGEPENGLLNLRLRITNSGGDDLEINKIGLFVAGTLPNDPLELPAAGSLTPGDSFGWTQPDDYIFRIGGNLRLYLKIYAAGHNEPHEEIIRIEPHITPGGGYHFWGKTTDLEQKEFWRVHGSNHANTRSQMFALDVKVGVARNGGVTERRTDAHGVLKDGTQNDHYRIWGKPIYAVAGGTVLHCRNDFTTNPRPLGDGEVFEDTFPDIAREIEEAGDGNGNFFTISNGSETILYAHMQTGSLNEEFFNAYSSGDTVLVEAGDFLGRAGNAGHSTRPHLHIHANRTAAGDDSSWDDLARPMNFRNACALRWSKIEANGRTGPWEKLDGRGMPAADCAVWPSDYKPLDLARAGDILFGKYSTIDKLSLLIPADIYARLKSPDPPPEQAGKYLLSIIHKMNAKEKERTLIHLSNLGDYVDGFREELKAGIDTK